VSSLKRRQVLARRHTETSQRTWTSPYSRYCACT